jgi:hypothetical protein
MRSCPDVNEDQSPKVNDRQAITEHRSFRRLGQEVIHEAEVGGGEKESDGIVRVPPLNQRVLHAGVNRIALACACRHSQGIADMQHRHRDGGGNIEPDGDVKVLFSPPENRAQQIDGERDPNDRDGNVDRPFQLRVFLARRQAQWQRHGRAHDDSLPAPEIHPAQEIREHPRLAQPLQGIVDAHEHAVADEGEDDRIGMQRTQPPEGRVLKIQVEVRPKELAGDE